MAITSVYYKTGKSSSSLTLDDILYIRASSASGYTKVNLSLDNANLPWCRWSSVSNTPEPKLVIIEENMHPKYLSRFFYDLPWVKEIRNINRLYTDECVTMTHMFDYTGRLNDINGNIIGLDVSGFDTSNVTDMSYMFNNCRATSIDVSGFDTSNVTNMEYMFASCFAPLDVSGFDTSNVTNMEYMFGWCTTTSIDVSGFDTSNVTNMNGMFYLCQYLTSLDVSGFDTSNVTDMTHMFAGCHVLPSLDVSEFNTSNVTSMWGMFSGCYALTTLDVSEFDVSNVTSIIQMFSNCQSLTSIDMFELDDLSITSMSYAFNNCYALTSIDLSGLDTLNVTSMSHMFNNCYALTSIDLSGLDTSNVTDMTYMFNGCSSLTTLDLSGFNISSADLEYIFGGSFGANTIYFPLDNNPSDYKTLFSVNEIHHYLMNKNNSATSSVINYWKSIANSYSNVHYEFDDNSLPTVNSVSALRVDSSGSKTFAQTGHYAYLRANFSVFSDYLPNEYSNILKSESTKVDGTVESITWTYNSTDSIWEAWYDTSDLLEHIFSISTSDSIILNSTEVATRTGSDFVFSFSKAFALVDYYHDENNNNEGIAFGKFATEPGIFDCEMPAVFRNTFSLKDGNDVLRFLFDFVYPVGSYYETSDSSFDPNVTWGGTWVLETAGQVHVSAGTGYTIGDTGGTLTHKHTTGNFTLQIAHIPSHNHSIGVGWATSGSGSHSVKWHNTFRNDTNVSVIGNTGGGQAHNHGNTGDGSNMQPYIVVNRWHRTA